MSFDKLADILNKLRSRNPALSKRMEEATALTRWDEVVGPQIAKHTKAVRIQDSVLWIEVDHPIWKAELHYRKRQILERLNAAPSPTENSPSSPPIQDLFFIEGRTG